jgi:nuclear transport factor 2 (NTF2) superfamily protein
MDRLATDGRCAALSKVAWARQVDDVYCNKSNGVPSMSRMLAPPFCEETAIRKVRIVEDGWNMRDPERVALAYSPENASRARVELLEGREAISAFLHLKWKKELDYRVTKELCSFTRDRLAVRFASEWHDAAGCWFRSCGNEIWEFGSDGLVRRQLACIKDTPIAEGHRKLLWPLGKRPEDHPSLTALGF